MQEAEYAIRLLAGTDLTLIERSVCIGMLVSILDRTRTERFSALYLHHMKRHAEELCLWQNVFDDTDLAEFYLWAAIDIAGTMVPPKMPALSPDYQNANRFKLLMVIMHKYDHLSWTEALVILKRFIFSDRCINSWRNSWKLGLSHMRATRPELSVR